MSEIWRDIDGYDGLYQISNLGNVKSLKYNKEKILKPDNSGNGYLRVILSKEGKTKKYRVHRLVASAFLDNPDNYNEVNHINEDKTDNRVDNLEWCDRVYNATYSQGKPVYSVNKTTNKIEYYQSIIDAGRRTNINIGNIWCCLNGKYKSTGGYKWYYVKNEGK